MSSFSFESIDMSGYTSRINQSIKFILVVCILIFLFSILLSDWRYATIFSSLIFITQIFKTLNQNRYFISRINIEDGNVKVEYTNRDEKNSISGKLSDFEFRKKAAYSKIKVVYLQVKYKNELVIKQYEIEKWTENIMNNIVAIKREV